jgi:hypothetical protein
MTHVLNRKIPIENPMHHGAFLPWLESINLGLDWSA